MSYLARLVNLVAGVPAKPNTPRSPKWPAVRKAWLKDHPACSACGGTDSPEVHHMSPFHDAPERELDPTNFITLCEHPGHNCHFVFGHTCNWTLFNAHVVDDAALFLSRCREARRL